MRAVLQRVSRGSVSIGGEVVAQIGRGMVILLGVGQGDTDAEAAWLADKIAFMRLFEDEAGKTNLSALSNSQLIAVNCVLPQSLHILTRV